MNFKNFVSRLLILQVSPMILLDISRLHCVYIPKCLVHNMFDTTETLIYHFVLMVKLEYTNLVAGVYYTLSIQNNLLNHQNFQLLFQVDQLENIHIFVCMDKDLLMIITAHDAIQLIYHDPLNSSIRLHNIVDQDIFQYNFDFQLC